LIVVNDGSTAGSEAADAVLLSDARTCFPVAKVTQVYTTTELGEVFRVADGKPVFPAPWLGRALPGGFRLSTRRESELLVGLSRDMAVVGTGDLVEKRGDRYEFVGRRTDVNVVGGAKAFPAWGPRPWAAEPHHGRARGRRDAVRPRVRPSVARAVRRLPVGDARIVDGGRAGLAGPLGIARPRGSRPHCPAHGARPQR